jgi:class 3 adenylate cyclase
MAARIEGSMSQLLDPSLLDQAQAALGRHAWGEAYELLERADADHRLEPAGLLLLAKAAWWVGRLPVAIDALERAYASASKNSDYETATIAAIFLGRNNAMRGAHSMATAWLNRAEHMLEGHEENVGTGWLAVTRAYQTALTGPIEQTLANAQLAADVARKFGDRDLATFALTCRGVALASTGQPQEGLALLDEAAVAAIAGELDPDTAGGVCCATISTSTALGEWDRAAQWTDAQDRWCEREGITGYPGMCRIYRAEIKAFRGSWLEAEAEARRAATELEGFIPAAVGMALYQIGELRLRRGDLSEAEEALDAAHAIGRAEPALSLLLLAQGKPKAALDSIRRAVEADSGASWFATPGSDLWRLSMLPAQVEIALAGGDVATARESADVLKGLAERFQIKVVFARAATAAGAVRLAEGDVAGALRELRTALAAWQEHDAPWDTARARVLLGKALIADGAPDSGARELHAAREVFERLDARPDLRSVDELLAGIGDQSRRRPDTAPLRALRTFVFTDIVESTHLAETVGDERWHRVLRWHDGTVRTFVAEHAGEEVKRTGDGFFLAFDDPDRAIEFALALQRRLTDPPADLGVPLAVRIGVHRSEANRSGLDYVGSGVNLAARLAGAATFGEILVSHATLDTVRRHYQEAGRRVVELKGMATPVEAVSIAWS